MNVKDPSQGEPTLLAAKLETLEQVTLVIRIKMSYELLKHGAINCWK